MDVDHRTAPQRAAAARAVRKDVPRSSHARWDPPPDRPDPLAIIAAQEAGRLEWLLPARHERMATSPFAFFRAGAAAMAADLAGTPTMRSTVQLCGDAHLANFGTYATAERRRVFDVNDFDETLPGPWEWDLKRLAVSFVLAGRANARARARARGIATRSVRAYHRFMSRFAQMSTLDVWYAQASLETIGAAIPSPAVRRGFSKVAEAARRQTSRRALGKLTETVGGQVRFRSEPPLLVPLRDLTTEATGDQLRGAVDANLNNYLADSPYDRRQLLARYRLVDIAVKAVGVSSVGTRCMLVLLQDRDQDDPLFLQVKQAARSVLEPYLSPSEFAHQGQRVVEGQRLMQAASDRFLGWSQAATGPQYYWRIYRDLSGSFDAEAMDATQLEFYADLCGWTLAHCHARSGDATAISAYLGTSPVFDEAVGDFAVAYADQVERDHARFVESIKDDVSA